MVLGKKELEDELNKIIYEPNRKHLSYRLFKICYGQDIKQFVFSLERGLQKNFPSTYQTSIYSLKKFLERKNVKIFHAKDISRELFYERYNELIESFKYVSQKRFINSIDASILRLLLHFYINKIQSLRSIIKSINEPSIKELACEEKNIKMINRGFDFVLISELPANTVFEIGNIYLEKRDGALKSIFLNSKGEKVEGVLDIKVDGILTKEFLNSKRKEILELIWEQGSALGGCLEMLQWINNIIKGELERELYKREERETTFFIDEKIQFVFIKKVLKDPFFPKYLKNVLRESIIPKVNDKSKNDELKIQSKKSVLYNNQHNNVIVVLILFFLLSELPCHIIQYISKGKEVGYFSFTKYIFKICRIKNGIGDNDFLVRSITKEEQVKDAISEFTTYMSDLRLKNKVDGK